MSLPGASASMTIKPLSGWIGLEVSGVRLDEPVGSEALSALHDAFLESCGVLVFPEQFLTPAALHEFAVLWGSPVIMPHLVPHAYPGYPDVLKVTNPGKAKITTERWHTDSIFLENPPAITMLAAQELPPVGGDTMWANGYLAYERLSAGMQRLLRGLNGTFAGSQPDPDTGEIREVCTAHAIVRTHPETGRPSLLAGHPGDSLVSLEDMTPDESRPLLDFLYRQASQPDLVYRHHWRPGDFVMWDNRCTLHYAIHDYGDAPRNLARVTVRVP